MRYESLRKFIETKSPIKGVNKKNPVPSVAPYHYTVDDFEIVVLDAPIFKNKRDSCWMYSKDLDILIQADLADESWIENPVDREVIAIQYFGPLFLFATNGIAELKSPIIERCKFVLYCRVIDPKDNRDMSSLVQFMNLSNELFAYHGFSSHMVRIEEQEADNKTDKAERDILAAITVRFSDVSEYAQFKFIFSSQFRS